MQLASLIISLRPASWICQSIHLDFTCPKRPASESRCAVCDGKHGKGEIKQQQQSRVHDDNVAYFSDDKRRCLLGGREDWGLEREVETGRKFGEWGNGMAFSNNPLAAHTWNWLHAQFCPVLLFADAGERPCSCPCQPPLSPPPPPQPLPLPQPRPPCAMPPPGLSGNCEPLCMCVWVYGIVVYSCGHRSRSSWLPPIVAVSIAVSSQFATNSPNHPTTQPPRHPLSPQPPTQSPARCNYFNKFKPQRNNKQFVFRLKCNFHNFLCKDMANGQRITTTIPNILHPFRGKLLQTDWVVEPSTSHNYYLFYLYAGALIFHRVFPTDQFFFPSTCTRCCCCCAFLLLLLLLLRSAALSFIIHFPIYFMQNYE